MVQFVCRPTSGFDPASEIKVAKALESLDDEWTIIHSVAWQGRRGKRQGDGEADFVLLSKSVGAIILEVKGGGVFLESGRWMSEDRHGDMYPIKDPFVQATASKVALHKWLSDTLSLDVPTMHAVAFPDVSMPPNLGPAGRPEIVIDRSGLTDITGRVEKIVSHWNLSCSLGAKEMKRIVNALAPTVAVRRTLADDTYDAEHALVRLTDEQRRAFSGLRRARRAAVFGGPGTGKTLLASEKAAQLADEGHKTLLVCYNALLAQALARSEVLKDVRVSTYHSLCFSELKRAGLAIPTPVPEAWWEHDAPLSLIEACGVSKENYDAIVVDEGQDFSADWLQSLVAILSDGVASPFYVFADADQKLWSRNWEPEPDWFPYELTINCRNTEPIASRVRAVVRKDGSSLGASGPTPKWSQKDKSADVPDFVCNLVARLIEDGFEASDIAVLCEDAVIARELAQKSVGSAVFCQFGGKGVVAETIARFKGLDAPAVVLVLKDGNLEPDRDAYVGFSRARSYLHVVGPTARQRPTHWNDS